MLCERKIYWLPPACTPIWGVVVLGRQPRYIPAQESNLQSFGLQHDAQQTEPHQSGR